MRRLTSRSRREARDLSDAADEAWVEAHASSDDELARAELRALTERVAEVVTVVVCAVLLGLLALALGLSAEDFLRDSGIPRDTREVSLPWGLSLAALSLLTTSVALWLLWRGLLRAESPSARVRRALREIQAQPSRR